MNANNYNEILLNIFYQSLDALVLLDIEQNRFVMFNEKACEMYGYTFNEFKKLTPYDLSAEFTNRINMEHKQEYIYKKGSDTFITRHKTKAGEIIDIYVKSKKILVQDRFLLFITLINIKNEHQLSNYFLQQSKKNEPQPISIENEFIWNNQYQILSKNNNIIELTPNEKQIIHLLYKNLNNITPKESLEQLLKLSGNTNNSLTLAIKRIRQKTSPTFIKTIYSKGYLLNL